MSLIHPLEPQGIHKPGVCPVLCPGHCSGLAQWAATPGKGHRAKLPRIFPVFLPCLAALAAFLRLFMTLRRFLPRVS